MKSIQIKSNQMLVFGERENPSTRAKISRSRVENQHTQPAYDVRFGNRTRATLVEGQSSHHCANTAPTGRCSFQVTRPEYHPHLMARAKMSQSRAQNMLMPANITSIVLEGCPIHLDNEIPGMLCRHHKVSC